MRRVTLAAAAAALVATGACAAPPIALELRFRPGDVRVYELRNTATSTIDVPGLSDVETTALVATARIHVQSVRDGETTLRVTLTPTRYARDGKPADPPEAQEATIDVAADGRVVGVRPVGKAPLALGGSQDDLGALVGAPLRRGRVQVGDRWRTPASALNPGSGSRTSRVAALRVVDDYRTAVVATATVRPVRRERRTAAGTLSLAGTETAATETAFAFDVGIPVRIRSSAQSDMSVQGPQGGTVTIRSETTLSLRRRERSSTVTEPTPPSRPTRSPTTKARPTVTTTGSPAR